MFASLKKSGRAKAPSCVAKPLIARACRGAVAAAEAPGNAISTAAVPTTINLDSFDYTYYAGFYGTTTPPSNILSGGL